MGDGVIKEPFQKHPEIGVGKGNRCSCGGGGGGWGRRKKGL